MVGRIKYLILGKGYIGTYLSKHLEDAELFDEYINDEGDAFSAIEEYQPKVVINCIGKTGNTNVDWCEDHKMLTFVANTQVPVWVAEACQHYGIHMINMGTGCVLEGDNLSDDAPANFWGSFYSQSKAICENILKEYDKVTTLRIRMPLSGENSPRNILYKVNNFTRVTNVENSITFLEDLPHIIEHVVDKELYGVVNATHPKATSISELALALGNDVEIQEQKDLKIGKRANVTMVSSRLIDSGFNFGNFIKMLNKAVEEFKNERKE